MLFDAMTRFVSSYSVVCQKSFRTSSHLGDFSCSLPSVAIHPVNKFQRNLMVVIDTLAFSTLREMCIGPPKKCRRRVVFSPEPPLKMLGRTSIKPRIQSLCGIRFAVLRIPHRLYVNKALV